MDKKAVSFLVLGLLLGVVLTSGAFSLASRGTVSGTMESARPEASAHVKPVVLKLSHVLDQTHPVHAAMEYMADRLKTLSGGSVRMEVFPNGQLGSETESIEQVQRGALAMVKTSAAPLEGFIPQMKMFGLPYLFRDEDHYWKVLLGDVGKELLDAGKSKGLKGLCYYDSGSRSFYTTKQPILSPADLVGKKIRVMRSETSMDMISTLGGAPTPIPWGELYTALQQGMVDGAENNPPSMLSSRHYEVTKHYALDEHTRIPDMVVFSQSIWASLSPQVQSWVQQAADASVTFERRLWKEKTEAALADLEKAGVKVYHPDKAPFEAKVQSMYEPLKGTPVGALVDRVKAVK